MMANLLGLIQIQVLLEGLCCIKGPNCTTPHFHKTEIGIYIIAVVGVHMTKIVRQFSRAGAWKIARDLLHILVNDDIPTFRVDDHAVFVESPRVDLRAEMLISALVMIHFDAIIFLHERLFISIVPELRVNLCSWTFRHLVVGCGIRLGARFQSPVVSNPLSHGSTAYGSHTETAQLTWWRVRR